MTSFRPRLPTGRVKVPTYRRAGKTVSGYVRTQPINPKVGFNAALAPHPVLAFAASWWPMPTVGGWTVLVSQNAGAGIAAASWWILGTLLGGGILYCLIDNHMGGLPLTVATTATGAFGHAALWTISELNRVTVGATVVFAVCAQIVWNYYHHAQVSHAQDRQAAVRIEELRYMRAAGIPIEPETDQHPLIATLTRMGAPARLVAEYDGKHVVELNPEAKLTPAQIAEKADLLALGMRLSDGQALEVVPQSSYQLLVVVSERRAIEAPGRHPLLEGVPDVWSLWRPGLDTRDGSVLCVPILGRYGSLLIGGASGAGKSTAVQGVVGHFAGGADLYLVDPSGAELERWADGATAFTDDLAHADQVIEAAREAMVANNRRLTELGVRKLLPEHGVRPVVVVVDETESILTTAPRKVAERFSAGLADLCGRGRKAAGFTVATILNPDNRVWPSHQRDKFVLRAALRCTSPGQAKTILGSERDLVDLLPGEFVLLGHEGERQGRTWDLSDADLDVLVSRAVDLAPPPTVDLSAEVVDLTKRRESRDEQVVRLKGEGLSNREIATRLGVNEKTVRNVLRRADPGAEQGAD